MNELELIKNLPISNVGIQQSAHNFLKSFIDSGNEPSKNLAVYVKVLSDFCDKIKSDPLYKEYVIGAGEDKEKILGCQTTRCESGVKYEFSGCQDSKWTTASNNEKYWKSEREKEEKILKALASSNTDFVNAETGECYIPPVKTSTTILKVELPKK